MKTLLYLVILISTIDGIVGPLASTWGYCECQWLPWAAWSSCTQTCYGRQSRDRKVRITQHPGCSEFTDCASNDMGSDSSDCNQFCNNGGTYSSASFRPCNCVPGKFGRCCDETVTCSSPIKTNNGAVSFTSTTYGSSATYTCDRDYNMTSGLTSRTCGANSGWSGEQPVCQYVNTCSSNPCHNGGTCVNHVESYTCQCQAGWSGNNCQNDVQPPVMNGCPNDQLTHTKEATHNVTWTVPQFSDPMGTEITMITNYHEGFIVAPWGDYVVQYVATKPFNGLQTECKFTVKVRPHPCPELNIPTNGARVCNGWKTEFARVCLVYCSKDFTLEFGHDPAQFYLCGASGNWLPAGLLPNCSLPNIIIGSGSAVVNYKFDNCGNNETQIQESYVTRLANSNQRFLCDNDPDECKPENVDVTCA